MRHWEVTFDGSGLAGGFFATRAQKNYVTNLPMVGFLWEVSLGFCRFLYLYSTYNGWMARRPLRAPIYLSALYFRALDRAAAALDG